MVDRQLVENAIAIDAKTHDSLMAELTRNSQVLKIQTRSSSSKGIYLTTVSRQILLEKSRCMSS
jgi:hypothetical protein